MIKKKWDIKIVIIKSAYKRNITHVNYYICWAKISLITGIHEKTLFEKENNYFTSKRMFRYIYSRFNCIYGNADKEREREGDIDRK